MHYRKSVSAPSTETHGHKPVPTPSRNTTSQTGNSTKCTNKPVSAPSTDVHDHEPLLQRLRSITTSQYKHQAKRCFTSQYLHKALELFNKSRCPHQIQRLVTIVFYSILFHSRLCSSSAGSSPQPESSNFLCPFPSLFIPLPVAPQCHLSNDVLIFLLSSTLHLPLCASNSPSITFHSGDVSSPFPFCISYVLDYICPSGS